LLSDGNKNIVHKIQTSEGRTFLLTGVQNGIWKCCLSKMQKLLNMSTTVRIMDTPTGNTKLVVIATECCWGDDAMG
jgi:hypothetical protein